MSSFLGNISVRGAGAFQGGLFVSPTIKLRDMHPEAAMKELRPAAKQANMNVILFWHRLFLPTHFRTSAIGQYNYQPRTRRYSIRKAKLKGHQKPLVWSGEGSNAAMRQIRPSGTSKQARGIMPGTQVFNFGRRADMPPMREEVVRTTRSQRRTLALEHERSVKQHLESIRGTTTKRV